MYTPTRDWNEMNYCIKKLWLCPTLLLLVTLLYISCFLHKKRQINFALEFRLAIYMNLKDKNMNVEGHLINAFQQGPSCNFTQSVCLLDNKV